jgi:Ca2+-binding EF-hand superfamily protein
MALLSASNFPLTLFFPASLITGGGIFLAALSRLGIFLVTSEGYMSISGVTGSPGAGISQYLAELLSQLQASQSTTTSSNSNSTTSSVSGTSSTGQSNTSVALNETQTPTLSDQVIGALVAIQMQDGMSSSTAATSNSSNPIGQVFASIDTNGDGSISQSELETAIENAGGTASEADGVYAALGGTSTSTSDEAAQIFSSLGVSQNGSISESQLASALGGISSSELSTANSNTSNSTSAVENETLSAFDGSSNGSATTDALADTLNSEQQGQSDQTNYESLAQLVYQMYNTTSSLLT